MFSIIRDLLSRLSSWQKTIRATPFRLRIEVMDGRLFLQPFKFYFIDLLLLLWLLEVKRSLSHCLDVLLLLIAVGASRTEVMKEVLS